MTDSHQWRANSKCRNLSPKESDQKFFPGRGGKSKQSEEFCKDCPVLSQCFNYALTNDVEGFYAGTSQKDRRRMAAFRGLVINSEPIIEDLPKKRKVFRKVVIVPDVHDWLDKDIEPAEEELQEAI